MPEWLLAALSSLQRGTVASLAAEMRAGGTATAAFAFLLGAVHALTPGHGKTALAAYFLGQETRLMTGIRVALYAALLHVAMGLVAFVVLRLIIGQLPSMTGRGSPVFAVSGYSLILLAGLVMVFQSLRPRGIGAHPHVLTVGVGLLPCPLTIAVLGFAWAQATVLLIAVVLVALASGIALTIGIVALLAMLGRRFFRLTLAGLWPGFERAARWVQAGAGVLIVAIAGYSIWTSL